MNDNAPGPPDFRKQQTRLQVGGTALGVAAAWIAGTLYPALPGRYTWTTVMLWGAALGASLFSWQSFERAGEALTRSPNRRLNLALGAGIPFGLLILLSLLLS